MADILFTAFQEWFSGGGHTPVQGTPDTVSDTVAEILTSVEGITNPVGLLRGLMRQVTAPVKREILQAIGMLQSRGRGGHPGTIKKRMPFKKAYKKRSYSKAKRAPYKKRAVRRTTFRKGTGSKVNVAALIKKALMSRSR